MGHRQSTYSQDDDHYFGYAGDPPIICILLGHAHAQHDRASPEDRSVQKNLMQSWFCQHFVRTAPCDAQALIADDSKKCMMT